MVLKVFHQNKGFLIKLSCAIEKKNTNKKNVPFLLFMKTHFFFSFPIWSTGSEYIWTQLTEHGDCWLLRNTVSSSLTGNRGTSTLLCVAAMEEIFWASVAKMVIKSEVKMCLCQIRELSIFNVPHSKTTRCSESWVACWQVSTASIPISTMPLRAQYLVDFKPCPSRDILNLSL